MARYDHELLHLGRRRLVLVGLKEHESHDSHDHHRD
jgi:hypothetical protein